MELTHPDGILPNSPLHAQDLEQQGFQQCKNRFCMHMLGPQVANDLMAEHGPPESPGAKDARHQCSHCGIVQNPLRAPGQTGGGTNAGIAMDKQGQIGEDLIQGWGEIPGYGPILWWHSGPAAANSALDGAVAGWGVEVKSYNWLNQRPRGIINPADKATKAKAINDPALFAEKIKDPILDKYVAEHPELKGLLGILVLLDFDNATADVFAHEMPRNPQTGRMDVADVKHVTRKLVLAEGVPFKHDLPDPRQEGWVPHHKQQTDNVELPF